MMQSGSEILSAAAHQDGGVYKGEIVVMLFSQGIHDVMLLLPVYLDGVVWSVVDGLVRSDMRVLLDWFTEG